MEKRTYAIFSGGAGDRHRVTAETVEIIDCAVQFKTAGEIVAVIPMHALHCVLRLAKDDCAPSEAEGS